MFAFVLFGLVACTPPAPELYLDFVEQAPLEVDTVQGPCYNESGVLTGYDPFFAEENCVQVSAGLDDWYIESRQVSLDFNDYCVTYALLNESGDLAEHCNGMALHVDAGETWVFPLRAVSYVQKFSMGDRFPDSMVNVRATLTMYATNSWNDDNVEISASYDIIMGNYDFCEVESLFECTLIPQESVE